ncbi:MAG TPA: hypothetical protein VGH87_24280 [Polyangiaceae bacterium]
MIADSNDFTMDLDSRLTDVCVFIPEAKIDENCDGMEPASAAAAIKHDEDTTFFAAVGKVGNWTLMLMASRQRARAEVKPDELDAFATTLRKGMARGTELIEPYPPPSATRINGVQVIELSSLARGPRDTKLWIGAATVIAAPAVYMVWATADAAHATEAKDIVQASLHTVKATPAPVVMPAAPEEKTARTADLMGRILGGVGGVVFLGIVIWLVARNRRTPMPTEPETETETESSTRRSKRKRKVVSWEKNKNG